MNAQFYSLKGKDSELLLKVSDCCELLYWGPRLAQAMAPDTLIRATPHGRLDHEVPLSLAAESARGLFSSPGLEGHRDGLHWSPVFEVAKVEQNAQHLNIIHRDDKAQLELHIELCFDENDVLKLRHKLVNLGEQAYSVNRLAVTLPLPEYVNELVHFHGRWTREFQATRQNLTHGAYVQENRRGRTSHENFPAFLLGENGFGETQGQVFGVHFAWSGNHRMRAEIKSDGRRYVQAEALYYGGEISLAKDEALQTPWVYASFAEDGLNGMSHHFHQHVRAELLQFDCATYARPVHLNTWEGIYFDHHPEYIMDMATEAAKIGVERFIIDDGWFRGRNDATAALGDWYLDEDKYPNGLTPVVEHIRSLGMEFGIWVEPEMINKNSDLYRAHPDWLLAVEGYNQPPGRNQYVLNMQKPEVFAYLLERMDWLLSSFDISYIKWDMNREVVQPGNDGVAAGDAQVHSYYRLIDELRKRHPKVEIESCSAGGGRIDFEVLSRTHRFWASDNNDPLERQSIQRGMSYFFPPEVMGSHIGAQRSHLTLRTHDINYRGVTALFGHMGLELDPVKADDAEKEAFAKYVALHKQYRDMLHAGRTYRLPCDDEKAQMMHSVVSTDQSQVLAMLAQNAMASFGNSGKLRFAGLDSARNYLIRVIDKPSATEGYAMAQPRWCEGDVVASGEWLMKAGLTSPVLPPESAMLIELIAQ